jgi:pimeloyl-ACP methyl ester carboxylesterase
MNPLFMHDDCPPPARTPLHRSLVNLLWRLLLMDVRFWRGGARLKIEDGSAVQRVLRAVLYRILFVPVLVCCVVAVLVYIGTHPPSIVPNVDPFSHGHYYDPVSFVSSDGVRLEGWLVPVIDARAILQHRDQALLQKHPAVILVHGHGGTSAQMLPLIQPFHDAGYVVLITALRSSCAARAGSTFGLREAEDVRAAADLLRRRSGIDPARIAVVGVGTGANAALLAAVRDPRIAAVVLDHPIRDADELVAAHLSPPQPWLRWLRPLCKWSFELAYRVDAEDVDLHRSLLALPPRPALLLDANAAAASCFYAPGFSQIRDFLARHLNPTPLIPTASVDRR